MFVIIVTKAGATAANQWMVDNVDPQGGQFTFTRKLYKGANHTHFVACFGAVTPEQLASMDAHFPYTYDCIDGDDIQGVIDQRGLNWGPDEGA